MKAITLSLMTLLFISGCASKPSRTISHKPIKSCRLKSSKLNLPGDNGRRKESKLYRKTVKYVCPVIQDCYGQFLQAAIDDSERKGTVQLNFFIEQDGDLNFDKMLLVEGHKSLSDMFECVENELTNIKLPNSSPKGMILVKQPFILK